MMNYTQRIFFVFAVFVCTHLYAQQEKPLTLTLTNSTTNQTVVLKKGSRVVLVYKDCNGQIKKIEDNIFEITQDGIELAMTSSGGRVKRGLIENLDQDPKLFSGDTKVFYKDILQFKKVFKLKPLISAILSAGVGIAAYYIIRNQFKDPTSDESEITSVLASVVLPPLVMLGFNKATGDGTREEMSSGWTYKVE